LFNASDECRFAFNFDQFATASYSLIVLRHKLSDRLKHQRPLVGIAFDGVTNYGRALMRGVMRFANMQRRWLIHEELRHIFDSVRGWPACDGSIIGGSIPSVFDHIMRRSRHVIHCSGSGDPARTPVVCLDDAAVGAMAAEHLLDCRLEHFGFYGTLSSPVSLRRSVGFVDAIKIRGFDCKVSPVAWPERAEVTHRHWPKLVKWLKSLPMPVGIMSVDDSAARDLAAACLEAGLSVPDRVAIIGVNNDDLLCDSSWPPLSSVDGDWGRVGYKAAEMLDRLLQGQTLKTEERLVRFRPVGVVRRLSTDVLAVDDAHLAEAIRFIREHACDPCTVHAVLRHVPVGRRWLERQFASKFGRTPHDEILRVRLELARRLLPQLNLTIPDIAARCGFSAPSNFGRAFQQATGTTPAAYRRAAFT
jgi:LacI family transcriptional regulator